MRGKPMEGVETEWERDRTLKEWRGKMAKLRKWTSACKRHTRCIRAWMTHKSKKKIVSSSVCLEIHAIGRERLNYIRCTLSSKIRKCVIDLRNFPFQMDKIKKQYWIKGHLTMIIRRCFVLANPLSLQHKSCSFETATSSWGIAPNSGV